MFDVGGKLFLQGSIGYKGFQGFRNSCMNKTSLVEKQAIERLLSSAILYRILSTSRAKAFNKLIVKDQNSVGRAHRELHMKACTAASCQSISAMIL